ncbi:MAG TPA: restriction endonuclease [Chloroflexota bacterium]|nr:restriction endonuclease [Chloroflexota bacterium]
MSRRSYTTYAQLERQRAADERRAAAEVRRRAAERQREERRSRLESRQQEVEALNVDLRERVEELTGLLRQAEFEGPHAVDFEGLKRVFAPPPFNARGLDEPLQGPSIDTFMPATRGLFSRILPGGAERHRKLVEEARLAHARALAEHFHAEQEREAKLVEVQRQYVADCERLRQEMSSQNAEIDAFQAAYEALDPPAVVQYFTMALERDQLPEGFPGVIRVAYVPESRQLVLEREMPTQDIIPSVSSFRYVKSTDKIETVSRPVTQIRSNYTALFSQLALRTARVVFNADTADAAQSLVLNCYVDTINPATGKKVTPCLLSLRVDKETFSGLDLANVDATACLKGLNAQVSRSPHELAPVRPIVEFNMVDSRFVDKGDVLSDLDQRPNLASLSPGEFETLITNLFEKMGLETRLTQASRDGGVDCVAWDMRPVLGGKVIVQAKRYKHTVGVSAVRDLYGTVLNEGASKGILITTSGYGRAAYGFAENKPLELMAGSNLLYLLEEHTGIKAKIEFPEDWSDPLPNSD